MSLYNPLVLAIFPTSCLHMNAGQDASSSPRWMACSKSPHLYPQELTLHEKFIPVNSWDFLNHERGRIHLDEWNAKKGRGKHLTSVMSISH